MTYLPDFGSLTDLLSQIPSRFLPSSRSSTLLHPISITCHDLRLSTIRYLHPLDTFYRSAGLQNLWLHYPQRMQRIEMQRAATNFARYRCTLDLQSMSHLCTSTLLGTNISHPKGTFEDDFSFPKVGYVSSQECILQNKRMFSTLVFSPVPPPHTPNAVSSFA